MKKTLLALTISSILFSCGGKETKVCKIEEQEYPCAYDDMYSALMDLEGKINASFEDNGPILTLDKKLALRENWVTIYETKGDSLVAAYELLGFGGKSHLESMFKMRSGEVEYFKEAQKTQAELNVFLEKIDIQESEVDTSFYEGSTPSRKLHWTITNNSDSTISAISIQKAYLEDGKLVGSQTPTTYLFSHDQIVPSPSEEEKANVAPGSKLHLFFDTSDKKVAQPKIVHISFEQSKSK